MFQRLAGIAFLSLAIAACGGKEEPNTQQALTPPPVENSPAPLPPATAADVARVWTMPALSGILQSGALVSARVVDDGVELTRSGDGEDGSTGRTTGAFIFIEGSNQLDYSGMKVDVTVKAKSANGEVAPFSAAYSTARKGNSGWFNFEAGAEETSFSFSYDIPEGYDATPDFIGISVPDGSAIIVTEVSVDLAP